MLCCATDYFSFLLFSSSLLFPSHLFFPLHFSHLLFSSHVYGNVQAMQVRFAGVPNCVKLLLRIVDTRQANGVYEKVANGVGSALPS